MIERKQAYSEEFDMSNFPSSADSTTVDRLSEYVYVYDKITADESLETALLNGDIKGLLKSEDELAALYSFEYQDPTWTDGYGLENEISKDKFEQGLRKFLMEKSSIIVMGTDQDL